MGFFDRSAVHPLLTLLALGASACLLPQIPGPTRPADPEVWYGQAVRADGFAVRVGGYLSEEGLRPLVALRAPGGAWTSRAFTPVGTARHGAFVTVIAGPVGLTVVAATDGADSLVVASLDEQGRPLRAQELSVGAVHGTNVLLARVGDQLVLGSTAKGGGARLLWLDSALLPTRAVGLPALGDLRSLAVHADGSVSALGSAASAPGATVLFHVGPDAEPRWARQLRFTSPGPNSLVDGVVAAAGDGGALIAGQHGRADRRSVDLELARFDGAGALLWAEAIARPYPAELFDFRVGPITQRAAAADQGGWFVAASAPLERQNSTHLVLLELDASGAVLRQSAVTSSAQRISEVQVGDGAVVVRGSFFFECAFDRARLDGCEAPLAFPAFAAEPAAVEVTSPQLDRSPLAPGARPVALESWPIPG